MFGKINTIRNSIFTLLLLALPLVILFNLNFLFFHILIEAYTIAIGVTIFVTTINSRQYFTNSFFLILGVAFLAVAVIDFIHSIAYEGMNIKPISSANTASQLWILARYIHAFSFLVALAFINKQVSLLSVAFVYATVVLTGIWLIFTDNFPIAYIAGHGQSTFKIISEFIVITCFVSALFILQRLKSHFDKYTLFTLTTAFIFASIAEVMFALYINVFSFVNALGHFFKMTAFYFFYRACVYITLNKPLESIFSSINENKKFLSTIIESLSYPFYVIDIKDYSIKLANSATGLTNNLMTISQRIILNSNIICTEKNHYDYIATIKKTKKPFMVEHVHIDQQGSKRNIEIYAYPIFDDSGEVQHVIEYHLDITEKKKERELIKKLSLAIEQSSNSILITDSEGRIEYVNSTFTKTTGYTPEEVIGNKPSIFKSGVTPDKVYQELWQSIKSDKIWKGKLCNKKKNGELFWEAITISPLKNESGAITHFVAIREDIQDKIRADVAEQKAIEHEKVITELQKELQNLEQMIQLHQPSITAKAYGQVPLRESVPEIFESLVKEYIQMLEKYIDVQIFKIDYNISDQLRDFTDKLGMLNIGARDLIDIHTTALKRKTINKNNPRTQAYKEEGRMMALELMGYLVNFYRNYSITTLKKS